MFCSVISKLYLAATTKNLYLVLLKDKVRWGEG